MITSSMNASDIARIRVRDNARLVAFQQRKANELLRELNRSKVTSMQTCLDFKTPNADYKVTFSVKGGTTFYSGIFGYMKEKNVYIPMSSLHENEGYYMALSPHFLNRYAERHLKRKMSISKSLANFFHDFVGAAVLYSDGKDKVVYAIYGGIMLGKYNTDKGIIFMKTFVSLDMLKNSQSRSYGKIKAFIEDSKKKMDVLRKKDDCVRINAAYDDIFRDITELDMGEAREIYATFFEKGGEDG